MQVVWTRPALRHLDEIQDYIAKDSPTAAYRVANAIVSRTDDGLSRNPLMGRRGRAPGTREFILSDLPYIVVYQVTSQVEVLVN